MPEGREAVLGVSEGRRDADTGRTATFPLPCLLPLLLAEDTTERRLDKGVSAALVPAPFERLGVAVTSCMKRDCTCRTRFVELGGASDARDRPDPGTGTCLCILGVMVLAWPGSDV